MTTTATARATRQAATPQWLRVTRWLARIHVHFATWSIPVAAVVIALLLFILSRVMVPEISITQFAQHAALWSPFVLNIVLTIGFLTIHVANGMTRRSFVRAGVLTSLLTGLLYAVTVTLMLVIERWAYGVFGWVHGGEPPGSPGPLAGGVLEHAWGLFLLISAGLLSGLLVGLAYYRLGGWVGTLALPLTLLPIGAMSLFALDPESAFQPWNDLSVDVGAARPVIGVLVLCLAALGVHLLARRIPITAKPT